MMINSTSKPHVKQQHLLISSQPPLARCQCNPGTFTSATTAGAGDVATRKRAVYYHQHSGSHLARHVVLANTRPVAATRLNSLMQAGTAGITGSHTTSYAAALQELQNLQQSLAGQRTHPSQQQGSPQINDALVQRCHTTLLTALEQHSQEAGPESAAALRPRDLARHASILRKLSSSPALNNPRYAELWSSQAQALIAAALNHSRSTTAGASAAGGYPGSGLQQGGGWDVPTWCILLQGLTGLIAQHASGSDGDEGPSTNDSPVSTSTRTLKSAAHLQPQLRLLMAHAVDSVPAAAWTQQGIGIQPQTLSGLSWSFATAGVSSSHPAAAAQLLQGLASAVEAGLLYGASPKELAVLLWGTGKLASRSSSDAPYEATGGSSQQTSQRTTVVGRQREQLSASHQEPGGAAGASVPRGAGTRSNTAVRPPPLLPHVSTIMRSGVPPLSAMLERGLGNLQDLSNGLYAVAAVQYVDGYSQMVQASWTAVEKHNMLASGRPAAASSILWALSQMWPHLPASLTQGGPAYGLALACQSQFDSFLRDRPHAVSNQTLAVGLRALATTGIYKPETFEAGLALALSRSKVSEGNSSGDVATASSSIYDTGVLAAAAAAAADTQPAADAPAVTGVAAEDAPPPAPAGKKRGRPRKASAAQQASDDQSGAKGSYRGPPLEWADVSALLWAAATVGHGLDADRYTYKVTLSEPSVDPQGQPLSPQPLTANMWPGVLQHRQSAYFLDQEQKQSEQKRRGRRKTKDVPPAGLELCQALLASTDTSVAGLSRWSPQALANTLWAWAVLQEKIEHKVRSKKWLAIMEGRQKSDLTALALLAECEARGASHFTDAGLTQVYMAWEEMCALELDYTYTGVRRRYLGIRSITADLYGMVSSTLEEVRASDARSSAFLHQARLCWQSATTSPDARTATSRSQVEVKHVLEKLGYKVSLEASTAPCIFVKGQQPTPMGTDILVLGAQPLGHLFCYLAVEFDGPSHFLSCPSTRLNGATLLNRKMLSRRVQTAVGIDWRKWDALRRLLVKRPPPAKGAWHGNSDSLEHGSGEALQEVEGLNAKAAYLEHVMGFAFNYFQRVVREEGQA